MTNGQRVLIKDGVLGGYASGTGAFGAYPTTYGGFASSWVANGLYEVVSYGGAATSGWLLVRATDSDNQAGFQELTGGTFTFVEEGTSFADNAFVCSNDTQLRGPIGFGATQISWTPFSGGASLTMGQGLTKSGNTIAANFKLLQATPVNANLSNGFSIGGERTGSVGSSSYATWVVTGSAALSTNTLTANITGFSLAGGQTNTTLTVAGVTAANTLTGAADGFTLAGGTTGRTLTVIGGNITVANGVFNGGGSGLTLSSSGNLNLNFQTLALSTSMGNLTFNAGNTTPSASTQNVVQSGAAQYNLSTSDTNYLAGDLYYGAGTAYTALLRLGFTAGTGNSVLIRGANAPAWGTIALGNSNFVSGTLTTTNGGTSNGSITVTNGQVVYTDGNKLNTTAVGTADQFLRSTGSGAPAWSAITLSNTTSVTGTLGIANGGTNATATPTNGGVSYGTGTAYAFTGAGTANSVLLSTGAGAPIWGAVVLSSANSVTGTLGISNGGTNSTATPTAGGAVYGTGTAYAITAQGTSGNVLISAGASAPSFSAITLSNSNSVTGVLPIANGGNNNTLYVAKGVVYTNNAGTANTSDGTFTFQTGFGLTITGSNTTVNVGSGGGYFINGTQTVSSVNVLGSTGGNGAVTFTQSPSIGGTTFLSQSGTSITVNYPGTGITGGGAQYQVPFYNAAREISGTTSLTWNTAGSGNGLSITSSGFGLSINNTSTTATPLFIVGANTSGNLIDARVSSTTEFSVRFDGFTTAGGGLTVQAGKSTFAIPTTTFASVNLPSSSGTNPGVGNTQIGDLWFNGTNLFFRRDANTSFDLLVGSVSGSGTANRIAKWSTSSALTDSNIIESSAGVGMTITATSAVGVGLGSTAYLTIQSLSGDEGASIKNNTYLIRGIQSATNSNTRVFSVDVAGNLRATTKSFDIPHPTKDGMRLVYGVLEGPEHGVYHRGTIEGKGIIQINLPDYWHKLVGDQYTIQLTPWGNYNVSIDSKTENYFTIQLVGDFISRKFKNIKVDYIVHGSRLDAPLDTEQ